MAFELEPASPQEDDEVLPLLEQCFERPGRESRLVEVLQAGCPDFDPGLALKAVNARGSVGWALFLPRSMRVRGAWVRCAISSPFGVLPDARRQGVGRFLAEAGAHALRDRTVRAAVVLGSPAFFGQMGYAPAFDLHTVLARSEDLPEAGDTSAWRGLTAEDIPHLRAMYFDNYRDVDGTEHRTEAPVDWESSIPNAYTLVLPGDDGPIAYVRFRVGDALEIRECGARSREGIDGVLRFVHRILGEHAVSVAEVHVPPPHPVARELYHRGNECRRSNFGGAALLRVLDWKGMIEDTADSWLDGLCEGDEVSLELDGEPLLLRNEDGELAVDEGTSETCHVHVPDGWGPPLLTGMRSFLDLLESEEVLRASRLDEAGRRVVRRLFPGGSPMWTYSPVFEIADD